MTDWQIVPDSSDRKRAISLLKWPLVPMRHPGDPLGCMLSRYILGWGWGSVEHVAGMAFAPPFLEAFHLKRYFGSIWGDRV